MERKMVLVITHLLFLLSLSSISSCGNNQTDIEHLNKATKYYESHKFNSSLIELKNAIAKNPSNAEARRLIGIIYVMKGMASAGEIELNKSINLGIDPSTLDWHLLDALLTQGKPQDILDHPSFNKVDTLRSKSISLSAQGDALFQLRSLRESREKYEEVVSLGFKHPGYVRSLQGLTRISIVMGDLDNAQSHIDSALKRAPKSPLNWMTYADLQQAKNNPEESIKAFRKAADLDKSRASHLFFKSLQALGFEYLLNNDLAGAQSVLSELRDHYYKKQYPNEPRLNLLRANTAFLERKVQLAKELALKVLKASPQDTGALFLLATIDTQDSNYELAQSRLQEFLKHRPDQPQATKLLAYINLKKRQPQAALNTLKPILDIHDREILSLAASASYQSNEFELSTDYFHQALDLEPENHLLRVGLAENYIQLDNINAATDQAAVMGKIKASYQSKLAAINIYIKTSQFDQALAQLKQLEQEEPEEALPVSLQATVHLLMLNKPLAKKKFHRALKLTPGFSPAALNLATLLIEEEQYDKAAKLYQQVLAHHPEHLETLYDFSRLLAFREEFNQARELLIKAREIDSNKTISTILIAQLYIRQNNPASSLAELHTLSHRNHPAILATQGNAQMLMGEYPRALSSYKKLVYEEPLSPQAYFLLYSAYLATGNKQQAKEQLSKALDLNADFLLALTALFEMELLDKDTDEAKRVLSLITEQHPDLEQLSQFSGDLAMLQGRVKEALNHYLTSYNKSPNNTNIRKLVQAYWKNSDKDNAYRILLIELKRRPHQPELKQMLANAYLNDGKTEEAIESYEAILETDSHNTVVLNNLAWLIKDKTPKRALELTERALKISPDNLSILDTRKAIEKNL